jgi:predicted tellurium resistance membrane protein TerC
MTGALTGTSGDISIVLWAIFGVTVAVALVLDVAVFHRTTRRPTFRGALAESAGWIALALAFNAWIYFARGPRAGIQFLTGYVVEQSLSVDNVFVFLIVFRAFGVAAQLQHRVLYYGVIGALVLRGIFVAAGVELLARVHFMLYVFGAILLITGLDMLRPHKRPAKPEDNWLVRLAAKVIPIQRDYQGEKFFVRAPASPPAITSAGSTSDVPIGPPTGSSTSTRSGLSAGSHTRTPSGTPTSVRSSLPAESPTGRHSGLSAGSHTRTPSGTPTSTSSRLPAESPARFNATPLFLALIAIEATDILLAVDSVPAVLAITRDAFIVYSSNVFAILGLRALYFAVAEMLSRLRFLHQGLAAILLLTGAKMLLSEKLPISDLASLAAIVAIMAITIAASLLFPARTSSRVAQ